MRSNKPGNADALERTSRVELSERSNWQSFYGDRSRRCPFFVSVPDENLDGWMQQGHIPGERALDVGCGNGRNAIYLANRGFAVDAVDQSRTAAEWAREQVAGAGAAVSVHCASIFDLEMQDGSYDLVYDSGCFHHIPPHQRDRYVQLVANVLKPGGAFGLVCFTPEGGSGYSDEEVYERGSLGWGLGYSEDQLRECWGGLFEIQMLRRMREQADGAPLCGKDFLWVMLGRKRMGEGEVHR